MIARSQSSPSTCISLLENVRESENTAAWREFVDRYSPLIYGYCRQRRLQESDAWDVTQNVFLAVSRAMATFEYDCSRGRFRSWLGTITCREIRRYLSRANRYRDKSAGPLEEPGSNLESEWESAFTDHLLREAMRNVRPTFSDNVWEAFERTWFRDEAPASVAQRLQQPIAWVYKAKFRVMSRLREAVDILAADAAILPR